MQGRIGQLSKHNHSGFEKAYRGAYVTLNRLLRPVDPDKVVFSCFRGRSYGDNPRCISERLHARCPSAKIVWLFTRDALARLEGKLPDYVEPLVFGSRQALAALATARVWVDNYTKDKYLSFTPGRQFYIQTWHGDRAIKKICYDLRVPGDEGRVEERCSRVVTGSAFGEGMFRTAFRYKGEYLKAGAPRNDILVKNDPGDRERIRRKLGVAPQAGLLLYAPTFREPGDTLPKRLQMDLERTLDALERRTGKRWICLFRAHYLSAGIDLAAVQDRLVDVTAYQDMAELLLAADMVLTDYSSCAMDFIIMDRPALFYIPDWEAYRQKPGVYYDVREAPFMTAADQAGLEALIEGLTPEKTAENCAAIREYFGYYETGRAADAVCDYIIERLGSREKRPD